MAYIRYMKRKLKVKKLPPRVYAYVAETYRDGSMSPITQKPDVKVRYLMYVGGSHEPGYRARLAKAKKICRDETQLTELREKWNAEHKGKKVRR